MASDRSRRNLPKVDYYRIHNGIPNTPAGGATNGDPGDIVSLFPEGEMSNFDEEDSAVVQELLDSEAAEIRELEARALALQQQQEEEARRQKTLDNLNKLQAMRERKALLQWVVAGDLPPSALSKPPTVTPASTPVNIGLRTRGNAIPSASRASKGGEFKDLYNSILHLRHGNLAPFADIMAGKGGESLIKAGSLPNMHDLHNLDDHGNSQASSRRNLNFDEATVIHRSNNECQNVDSKSFVAPTINNSGVKSVAFKDNGERFDNGVTSAVTANKSSMGHSAQARTDDDSDDESDTAKKGKKKKSGILTKPDEVDIVQTVRFPHELLDDRHIKAPDKLFAKLNFTQLCAGELELIKRAGVPQDERDTRIEILLTLCYHSAYLSTDELKSQYIAIMQRIERGCGKWEPVIAERLHNNLAFRASVISREKEKSSATKVDKPTSDKNMQKGGPKVDSKLPIEAKIHYCADFNRGTCSFKDNHEGRLNNRDVTLWHLCKRCLLSESKLKRGHPESDPACPSRA